MSKSERLRVLKEKLRNVEQIRWWESESDAMPNPLLWVFGVWVLVFRYFKKVWLRYLIAKLEK